MDRGGEFLETPEHVDSQIVEDGWIRVDGKPPRHLLHISLSLITLGLWYVFFYAWVLALDGWKTGQRRVCVGLEGGVERETPIIRWNRVAFRSAAAFLPIVGLLILGAVNDGVRTVEPSAGQTDRPDIRSDTDIGEIRLKDSPMPSNASDLETAESTPQPAPAKQIDYKILSEGSIDKGALGLGNVRAVIAKHPRRANKIAQECLDDLLNEEDYSFGQCFVFVSNADYEASRFNSDSRSFDGPLCHYASAAKNSDGSLRSGNNSGTDGLRDSACPTTKFRATPKPPPAATPKTAPISEADTEAAWALFDKAMAACKDGTRTEVEVVQCANARMPQSAIDAMDNY